MSKKPIVHYEINPDNFIVIGHGALVQPIDHPSGYVTNNTVSRTTEVLSYSDTDHLFETLNTVYQGVIKG